MKTNAVIIPIYKEFIANNELISLNRCLEVLGTHEIVFVAPQSLNLKLYRERTGNYKIKFNVEFFDDVYFNGTDSYNRLLLSDSFYKCFIAYEYILIYQLDAYVFCDELDAWCSKGFDFIGAPLVGYYTDTEFSTNMRVGNGGFSLRKTSTFIHAFDFDKNILSAKEIINRYAVFKKPLTRLVLLFLMILGYRNKLNYFAKNWKYNEDDFWSGFLDGTNYPLSKPTADEALEFSFERFPQDAYDIIHKLPFGCHAWEKYQFKEFWIEYIK